MNIILRKVRGISGLTPVLRGAGGGSFGASAPPSSVLGFLTHPLVLALLAIAFVIAWALAGGLAMDHVGTISLAGMAPAVLREKKQQRAKLIADARAITEKAQAEKRELTTEENANFDKAFRDAEALKVEIEREEKLIEAERTLASEQPDPTPAPETRQDGHMSVAELRTMLPKYHLGTPDSNEEELRERFGEHIQLRSSAKVQRAFRAFMHRKLGIQSRALQADLDASGGFLVTPIQFIAQLLKSVDDLVFIRDRATKFLVPAAASAGVPTLDADPADADWTSELASGSEDSTMAFGKRELHPHPLAKRIKVSKKLIRTGMIDVQALVRDRLGYKFAISEEKAFLTGSGDQKPLGLFTANANGIPTTRDVATENTTTEMTANGLINAKYSLKASYWKNAAWGFHRDGLKQISKLTDGNGQYLWRPSVREGEPDQLLGFSVFMSENIPNTFTTGQYVGILGDFSYYWIIDALDMQLDILNELYAESNQIGMIGRRELDGQPVLAEAFARVKLA